MTYRSQENHPTVQRVLPSQRLSEKKGAAAHGQRVGAQDRRCLDEAFEDTQIAFSIQHYITAPTMDAGIIQAFKLYYRQSLHSHIMHKVKADITCNPLNDVTIALAIVWAFRACCKVNPRTSPSASKVRMTPERLSRTICPYLKSRPVLLRNCSECCRDGRRQHIPTHREGRGLVYRNFCRHRC